MAATSDKYSANVLMESAAGVSKKIAYLPLALQEYVGDSQFMQLFHVDAVRHSTDSAGKSVVLGLLQSAGSPNRVYHADARIGRLHIYANNQDYILLNDGGLNTKGDCSFYGTTPLARYANYIKLAVNIASAYYVATDYFSVSLYKVAGSTETFLASWHVMVDGSSILPAKASRINYPTAMRNLGGVAEGDQIKAVLRAVNSEGTYEAASITFTLLGAMEFIQVYRHTTQPTINTPPTSGTPYVMVVSEDMYHYDPTAVGGGGVFGILFHSDERNPISVAESAMPRGAAGTLEAAYDEEISTLPDGYYYGVPTAYNGGELVYVQVTNGNVSGNLEWFRNTYITTDYTIAITYDGYRSLGHIYVHVYAELAGSRNNDVSIHTEIWTSALHPELIRTFDVAVGVSDRKVLLGTLDFTEEMVLQSMNTSGAPTPRAVTENMFSTLDIPEETT